MARSRETNTEGVGVGEAATKNRQVRKGRQRKLEGGRRKDFSAAAK